MHVLDEFVGACLPPNPKIGADDSRSGRVTAILPEVIDDVTKYFVGFFSTCVDKVV